jgi:putative hydrolase of the HAD superfamily
VPLIKAVVCDFGGVLTSPLIESFAAFQDQTGISGAVLGEAMQTLAERDGAHPLYELETGRITEADFLERIASTLEPVLGHRPEMHRFSEIYFEALQPNEPMIELMREIKRSGRRMALLTNNVREWEPLWRTMLPVDEIFEFVVDSGFVGIRKPDPPIYEMTIARLSGVSAENCLFVDDLAPNIETARAIGMNAVQFRANEQAIPEIRAILSLPARD